jgi:hypothetical protein
MKKRKVFRVGTLLALFGLAAAATPAAVRPAAAANPIVTENQQPGDGGWELGSLVADDTSNQIKGYTSAASVAQGGSMNVYVTVNPVQTYTIDFYRIGWYDGWGGRLRLHVGPLSGVSQPACVPDATTGLNACNWTSGYTLNVPSDWTSGVYMGVLTNAAGYQNYINFVVKDGRPATFLYQRSITTDQSYNNYPDDKTTGKSLYDYNSYGATTVSGTARAVKVSYDRPFADDGAGNFLNWEIQFVRWAEKSGYDLTYTTDIDTHVNGAELRNHRGFISAGHDEYYTAEMRSAVEAARNAGVNLAFLGANAIYWQIRFEASAAGVPNRVQVCYKSAATDPVQGPTTTVRWRDAPVNNPEQTVMGVMFTSETEGLSTKPYVVTNSSNWVYNGTGLKDGDSIPGLVGYEADRLMSEFPAPSGSQTLLSHSPYTADTGAADYSNSSIYQAPSGAWVFASGTMSWSWGLDGYYTSQQPDARIQQATANVLNAFIPPPPGVHDLKLTAPATATAGQAFSVGVTAEDSNGNPVPSYNGTVHFSSSDTASGVVLPADSMLTNGQGSFSVTLVRAGSQTLTVSDAANNLSSAAKLTISAAAATSLALAGPATTSAGSSYAFTVAAKDAYGNTDTSYAGTVHFTTSDPAPVSMPADATLTNGQGSFSASLRTLGTQTISGTDTASSATTGKLTVQVKPGAATSITLGVPGTVQSGQAFNVTVTLKDQFGNVATGYRGTMHFSSSDLLASLPADYTFTSADAGSRSFSVTFRTILSQTITVTDTANPSLTATSRPINVILL